jgi:hypothetical protein
MSFSSARSVLYATLFQQLSAFLYEPPALHNLFLHSSAPLASEFDQLQRCQSDGPALRRGRQISISQHRDAAFTEPLSEVSPKGDASSHKVLNAVVVYRGAPLGRPRGMADSVGDPKEGGRDRTHSG